MKAKYVVTGTMFAAAVGGCFFAPGSVNAGNGNQATLNATGSIAVGQPGTTPTAETGLGYVTAYDNPKFAKLYGPLGFTYAADSAQFSVYFEASKERPQTIKQVRVTLSGTIDLNSKPVVNSRLEDPNGIMTTVPSATSSILYDVADGKLVILAGQPSLITAHSDWSYVSGGSPVRDIFFNFYADRKIQFSIERPEDIVTASGAPVRGTFPLMGATFNWCCKQ